MGLKGEYSNFFMTVFFIESPPPFHIWIFKKDALLIFALIRKGVCTLYNSRIRHCLCGPVGCRIQISPAQSFHWTHANSCFKVTKRIVYMQDDIV